jgi:membrane protein YdbS with pleckstrin-like domain
MRMLGPYKHVKEVAMIWQLIAWSIIASVLMVSLVLQHPRFKALRQRIRLWTSVASMAIGYVLLRCVLFVAHSFVRFWRRTRLLLQAS